MAEDSERIRQEIEETRQAIRQEIEETRAEGHLRSQSVAGRSDALRSSVSAAMRRQDGQQRARGAARLAQENPFGLALGSVAVGFVAGLLLPSTRWEHERIGPVADQVKERAAETGQEVLERGKQVAQDAAETANESGQRHGEELRSSAQQRVEDSTAQPGLQGRD